LGSSAVIETVKYAALVYYCHECQYICHFDHCQYHVTYVLSMDVKALSKGKT